MLKKVIVIFVFVMSAVQGISAQKIANNAIGLRFGGGHGIGIEISYQLKLKEINRVEMDLGYRTDDDFKAVKLTGIYQWVWNIDKGFNWYAGVGGGLGSWGSKANDSSSDNEFYMNVDGDIGIEYDFDFPMLISFDIRPEVGLFGNYDSFNVDLALALRYQF